MNKAKKQKILFYALPGIGDALMMFPAIRALKENLKCKISVLTMYKPVFEICNSNKNIDEVFFWDYFNISKFATYKFLLSIKRKIKPDISIMGYPANRVQYSLLSLFFSGKKRYGHRYIKRDFISFNWLYSKTIRQDGKLHNVIENLKIINLILPEIDIDKYSNLNLELGAKELLFAKRYFNNFSNKKIVGIHAGSAILKNHKKRRWPKEKFKILIKELEKKGFQTILFGSRLESDLNNYIKGNSEIFYSESLLKTAAIIKHLPIFLSGDTGLMHLAASVNTTIIALFGPTNLKYIHPFCKSYKIISKNYPCQPCFEYSSKALKCKEYNDFRCIKDISVDSVLKEIVSFFSKKRL